MAKSHGTNDTFGAFLGTRQTNSTSSASPPTPHPPVNVENYPAISSDFPHCIILFCFLLPRRLTYILSSRNGTKRLLKEMTGNQSR